MNFFRVFYFLRTIVLLATLTLLFFYCPQAVVGLLHCYLYALASGFNVFSLTNPHEHLTTLNSIPLWGTKKRILQMKRNYGDCEGVDLHHT